MKKLNGDKQMADVWQLPSIGKWEKLCGKHPTQKSLDVLARIIQASSEPDSWILDPSSGSGTTGIAADLLGRNYLGLEKDKDFLPMSKKRREELENPSVRTNYLRHLEKNGIMSQSEDSFLSGSFILQHGIPWLQKGSIPSLTPYSLQSLCCRRLSILMMDFVPYNFFHFLEWFMFQV